MTIDLNDVERVAASLDATGDSYAASLIRQQAREIEYLKQSTAYKTFKQAVEAKLAAEQERDALRADAERLDWLDAQCSEQGGRTFVACIPGHLRAAIDAARQAAGEKHD